MKSIEVIGFTRPEDKFFEGILNHEEHHKQSSPFMLIQGNAIESLDTLNDLFLRADEEDIILKPWVGWYSKARVVAFRLSELIDYAKKHKTKFVSS